MMTLTWIRDDGIGDFGGYRCSKKDYQIARNSSRRFVLYGAKEGGQLKPLCKGSLAVCKGFAQSLEDKQTEPTNEQPPLEGGGLRVAQDGDAVWWVKDQYGAVAGPFHSKHAASARLCGMIDDTPPAPQPDPEIVPFAD